MAINYIDKIPNFQDLAVVNPQQGEIWQGEVARSI